MLLERILLHFLEGFFMAGTGLSIFGIRLKLRQITTIGGIYGLFVFSVRSLYTRYGLPMGTHALVLTFLFALLLILLGKQNIAHSFMAALTCLLLLYLGENVLFMPLLTYLKIDLPTLLSKPGGILLLGSLIDLPLILLFCICYLLKLPFFNISSFSEL